MSQDFELTLSTPHVKWATIGALGIQSMPLIARQHGLVIALKNAKEKVLVILPHCIMCLESGQTFQDIPNNFVRQCENLYAGVIQSPLTFEVGLA